MSAASFPSQAVIVVSSHVVRGSVGNRAAVFALETLGHAVWAMPTIILPWHPGHGAAHRFVLPSGDFSAMIDDLIAAPWLGEVGAVLSGYLGEAGQARAIARLVGAVKEQNPKAHYLCDPVIGDLGGLYVAEATAVAIRDELLPLASIATPNRFELEWLSGAPLADNQMIAEAALSLGPARVIVSSAYPMLSGGTGNLYLSASATLLAEHRAIAAAPKGLGDLLSAVYLSRVLKGFAEDKALQSATASVFEALARTAKRGADELTLESDASSLRAPMAMVNLRQLRHPGRRTVS